MMLTFFENFRNTSLTKNILKNMKTEETATCQKTKHISIMLERKFVKNFFVHLRLFRLKSQHLESEKCFLFNVMNIALKMLFIFVPHKRCVHVNNDI